MSVCVHTGLQMMRDRDFSCYLYSTVETTFVWYKPAFFIKIDNILYGNMAVSLKVSQKNDTGHV